MAEQQQTNPEAVEVLADFLDQLALAEPDDEGWEQMLDLNQQAERILADPGPLLEALAEAGVLTRTFASLPPRQDDLHPRGRGGVHWAAMRYVTEWMPDNA